jgi:hypothetical protein
VPLCRLHRLLNDFDNPDSIDEAVDLVSGIFSTTPASTVDAIVVNAAVNHPETLGEKALAFVFTHLDALNEVELKRQGVRLAASLWARDAEAFTQLFTASPTQQMIAEQAMKTLPISDLGKSRSEGAIIFQPISSRALSAIAPAILRNC